MTFSPRQVKRRHEAKDGEPCYYCQCGMYGFGSPLPKNDGRQVTVDHKTPVSRGGGHTRQNLVLCCRACNELKGDLTEAEFELLVGWAIENDIKIQRTKHGYRSLRWVASCRGISVDLTINASEMA